MDSVEIPIEIRRMSVDDATEFGALENEIFPGDAWTKEQIVEELGGPFGHYYALTQSGRIVGYGGIKGLVEGDLTVIGLVERVRGSGLGSLLLVYLLKTAKDLGMGTVFLEVRASNQSAIRLYQANGFESVGRIRNYYRTPLEDAETMVAVLGNREFS